jgi:pantothenate synthetase
VAVVNGVALEYAEVRRQADLQPFAGEIDAPPVMLVAAKIGTTRLIDNLELDQP